MTGDATAAQQYWQRHYNDRFVFGQGTEDILAALMLVPPVDSWLDAGSGSESMLWAIPLRPAALTAVDVDPERLAILREHARTAQPRPSHATALHLCGRNTDDFAARCRSLTTLVATDCLTGHTPADPRLPSGRFDLVTQFGLLGLCGDPPHFTACFAALHTLLAPGGWCAGANWVATDQPGRVPLTNRLYRHAATTAAIQLTVLRRIQIHGDPNFPALWFYLGRKTV